MKSRRLVLVVLASLIAPAARLLSTAAQAPDDLNGSWMLDRPASTFGPGDWGAAILDIRMWPERVTVSRTFEGAEAPAVWEFPLDGSMLPPPKDKGTARVVGGKLQLTFQRVNEVVTYLYTVDGDTLLIERTIETRSGATPDFTHTMVYHRAKG